MAEFKEEQIKENLDIDSGLGSGGFGSGIPLEGATNPTVMSLDEAKTEDAVRDENLEFDPLVAYINGQYRRAADKRQADEERWLLSYRNYRGLYGPDVKFTDTEKSRVFVKITKTKVLASYAQLVDVLFAGNKFPIAIEPTDESNGAAETVNVDPTKLAKPEPPKDMGTTSRQSILDRLGPREEELQPVQGAVSEGPAANPQAVTLHPAQEAAKDMEKKIHDQLEESNASKHLRSVAFEMALFGTGILKGPFAYRKEYPKWSEDGNYDPKFDTIAKVTNVSIWDFFPDPDARNMDEAEYVVERHRMSRTQLRSLKKRDYFRKESIELAIKYGPNYHNEDWEEVLRDNELHVGIERYEVLEYWGIMDRDMAEMAEIDIPDEYDDLDEFQVNCWVCNNQIIRLVLNPFTPSRIPYQAVPYELNPYSFFGVGIAENMEDTQLLMNGFMRMAVDNAALSGNLMLDIDETFLVPGQSMDIYPGKIWKRQAGSAGQAVVGIKFPNVTQENMFLFDKARQLSDEATGMPSYSHGSTAVGGVGRTASGMSMLMAAADKNIKAVVRNIDDYLLGPLGRGYFAFNMQFNFDEKYTKGDLAVISKGTESLMRNEVRSQKLLQFMQIAGNPMMAPMVKFDYILRELAASLDLDEEKIINDPTETKLQALLMQANGQMPMPGQGGSGQGGGQNNPQGAPSVSDQTGNGGGNVAPGGAPGPDSAGFTGGGGGANGGNTNPNGAGAEKA